MRTNSRYAKKKKTRTQMTEDVKQALCMRGTKASQMIMDVMMDLAAIKKPHCKILRGRNPSLRPFEESGMESLCFLGEKNDCPLFCVASHSKKRPHNLVMGRTFNWTILDMFELGVTDFVSAEAFRARGVQSPLLGGKPALVFMGSDFEHNPVYARLQNFFADYFRGFVAKSLNIAGIDHAIVCTAHKNKIFFRHYFITIGSKDESFEPELTEIGPRITFSLRRNHEAAPSVRQASLRQPRQLKRKKQKNVSRNSLDDKVGRIHVGRQNLDSLVLHKGRALRKKRRAALAGEAEPDEKRPRSNSE